MRNPPSSNPKPQGPVDLVARGLDHEAPRGVDDSPRSSLPTLDEHIADVQAGRPVLPILEDFARGLPALPSIEQWDVERRRGQS